MRQIQFVSNNDIQLLEGGLALFPAVLSAIDSAEHDIYFETYIWACDDAGNAVQEALIRAAGRGVKVRVLADWWGTGHRGCTRLGLAFAEAGVRYRVFNPWFKRAVAGSHRKSAVIDREVA